MSTITTLPFFSAALTMRWADAAFMASGRLDEDMQVGGERREHVSLVQVRR